MRQHLIVELASLNAVLAKSREQVHRMLALLLCQLGASAGAEMQLVLPDLQALEDSTLPPSWHPWSPSCWPSSCLESWVRSAQAAHKQLHNWAKVGGLRSYFLPALLHPRGFLAAAKVLVKM